MRVQSLCQEDHLEEGMTAHSSIPVWRIQWTEEPGGLQSIGLRRIGHDCNDLAHTHRRWVRAQRQPLLSTLRPVEFVPSDQLTMPRAVSPVIPPSFLQGSGGADGQGARQGETRPGES